MALAVIGSGMLTSVGYAAPSSCAAIRCGLNRFEETRFKFDGQWVVGAAAPVHGGPRGADRLLVMAGRALEECLSELPLGPAADTACVVCLPETSRPGRPKDLERRFDAELVGQLSDGGGRLQRVHFRAGRLDSIRALEWLEEVIAQEHARFGIVVAVDSLLSGATLRALHASGRILHSVDRSGLIPGEAAAGIVVSRPTNKTGELQCLGIGWGHEPSASERDLPLRGEGLASAIREALKNAGLAETGCGFADIDYRICDADGQDASMKEAALALVRVMRVRKAELALWLPAESLGEVGVAAPCVALGVALAAIRRRYARGPGVLTHFGDENGRRAAVVLRQFGLPSSPVLEAGRQ